MQYELEMRIPELPVSLNILLRMHWQKRNRYNNHWYKQISLASNGKKPKKELEQFKLTFIRYSNRFLDFDGCVGSLKPIVDGLIHAGIIKDDSYKMTGPWDVSQEYLPKSQGQYIYIKVTDWGAYGEEDSEG